LPFTHTEGAGAEVPRSGSKPINSSQSQRLSDRGPRFMENTNSLPITGSGGLYFSAGAVTSRKVMPTRRGRSSNESKEVMPWSVFR
jgi:hypothetical protein